MPIKNIIFDLCGPIITIDIGLISKKMQSFGVSDDDAFWTLHKADVTRRFESNAITVDDFYEEVRLVLHSDITNQQIFESWNTLITAFPQSHIDLLLKLKRHYRLFLLSNSDVVNAHYFTEELNRRAGFDFVGDVFEHAYFSCELGLRKPDPAIFHAIIDRHQLRADETLVIDDCPKHIEGASKTGSHAILLKPGCDVSELFDGIEVKSEMSWL
jgi:haloacid dehalogenase superfamily, subfamily IA, variant 3 with third motif having DD or ED